MVLYRRGNKVYGNNSKSRANNIFRQFLVTKVPAISSPSLQSDVICTYPSSEVKFRIYIIFRGI